MTREIAELTASSGERVVVVKNQITHLAASASEHTEIHLTGGSYTRVRGTIDEVAARFWASAEPEDG